MAWFGIVRVSNVQTIRWVLGALNEWSGPVSTRQAQAWCARMQTAGYIDRVDLGGAGGSIVWAKADGVAIGPDWVELIEVELTAKRPIRYDGIFRAFRRRLPDEVSQITYLCSPDAGRAVRTALGVSLDGASIKQQVQVYDVFDRKGHWEGDVLPHWLIPVEQRASGQHGVAWAP